METRKISTVENVLNDMREKIFLGDFDTSRPLAESDLSAMYGVSRGSVRTAIQALESEGLVIVSDTGRKMIRRIDQKFTEDLYTARIMLETQAARICIEKEDIDYSLLANAFSEFYKLYSFSGQALYEMRSKVNTRFHRAIILSTGNISLIKCWDTIEPMIRCLAKFNYCNLGEAQTNDALVDSHRRLMDSILKRDPGVTALVQEHIGLAQYETGQYHR